MHPIIFVDNDGDILGANITLHRDYLLLLRRSVQLRLSKSVTYQGNALE